MNYCVLGAGAWGTALAIHLARRGLAVTLVSRRIEHALELAGTRENRDYLPGHRLDTNVQLACELAPALMEADVVFLACPMRGLSELCSRIDGCRDSSWRLKVLISLCKGLEPESLLRPAQIIERVLPDYLHGTLSGPSFAHEVAAGKPTAVTLACSVADPLFVEIQTAMSDAALRVYLSRDLLGVELGACLKNIYAIGAGIADALELGENAKAAYMTRALKEMRDIGIALGAEPDTFFGLSGFGDFVVTCGGKASRNRSFGENLGRGATVAALMEGRRTVVEGYASTQSFHALVRQKKLNAPILEELYAVLYAGKSPRQALGSLMMRELKEETQFQ